MFTVPTHTTAGPEAAGAALTPLGPQAIAVLVRNMNVMNSSIIRES